jgi:hypothetical protein
MRISAETGLEIEPSSANGVGRTAGLQPRWISHKGGLTKDRVMIRFGENPGNAPAAGDSSGCRPSPATTDVVE